MLACHGASSILCDYDDTGLIEALSFKIPLEKNDVSFRLPCDWRPVLNVLEEDIKVPRGLKNKDQALKVAWRIVKDWVEAQLAIVETQMVKTQQVFLPYAVDANGKTFYEHFEENPKFLLLSS